MGNTVELLKKCSSLTAEDEKSPVSSFSRIKPLCKRYLIIKQFQKVVGIDKKDTII